MFGSDGSPVIQYVSIFAVIFALLTILVLLVRRFSGGGLAAVGRSGARSRQPRLGIVDVYELDRQRQLILLRRDNVEHLLLVGGPNDVVIERHIQRGQRLPVEPTLRPEALPDAAPEPLPEPLPAGSAVADAEPVAREIAGRRRSPVLGPVLDPSPAPVEARFAMPVVIPPAVPGSRAAPSVTLPLDPATLGTDEDPADAPTADEPEAEAPAPVVPPRRTLLRTAPPVLNPRGGRPPAEPSDAPGDGTSMPLPIPAPAEPPEVDPVILSDMARQLQRALAQPSSAVTPAPAAEAPEPETPAAPPPVDPLAAGMAAAPDPAVRGPDEARPPRPAAAWGADPQAAQVLQGARAARAPGAERQAAPVQPGTARGTSEANPFSVEEIEAEFARLLGRPLDKRG